MSLFVDTSALYAVLVATERRHEEVVRVFRKAIEEGEPLCTSSYVLVETAALLQHRIGLEAVLDLEDRILPLFEVEWVDRALHRAGMTRLRREARRSLSLVDCTSFEVMRKRGLDRALALDAHFGEAGFTVVPAPASR